jgi:hypothetical protein
MLLKKVTTKEVPQYICNVARDKARAAWPWIYNEKVSTDKKYSEIIKNFFTKKLFRV